MRLECHPAFRTLPSSCFEHIDVIRVPWYQPILLKIVRRELQEVHEYTTHLKPVTIYSDGIDNTVTIVRTAKVCSTRERFWRGA